MAVEWTNGCGAGGECLEETRLLAVAGHALQLVSAMVMVPMLLLLLPVLFLKLLGVNRISPRAAGLN